MRKMKILVIGASGILAGPVIEMLDQAGFDLRLFSRKVNPSMFVNDYDMVQGDLFNPEDLDRAVSGCDAIHITVSHPEEDKATAAILESAMKNNIKKISMVSGCTVAEENRWFPMIDKKFRAEQMLIESGIPYYIFRPTWFFESLELMVRNGKATVLGNQKDRYHWVAARDFGKMVSNAYLLEGKENRIYYVYGPERYNMKDLLEKYCRKLHPGIEKVSVAPIPALKFIAFLTRNRQLKFAASLFSYFEKVREPEIPQQELAELGRPELDFDAWIESKTSNL